MRDDLRKLPAFLRRDWGVWSRSRLALPMQAASILLTMAPFFFLGKLIGPDASPVLAPYGGSFFPFVLLGLAFSRYLTTSLASFGGSLREEQLQGTLEAMLATPTSVAAIVTGGMLWHVCWTTLEVALYLALGTLVFGVDLGRMNLLSTAVMLGLTMVTMSSLGLLSASGVLLFKEADPVNWVISGLMKLASGVYFPVALLPGGIQAVAGMFPLTYALEGLRQAVLIGRPVQELWGAIGALLAFAVILWPLALVSFSLALRRLKTTGALSFR